MTASKIKVLHLLASNFVGGPEKQILHHARDIREAGVEVYVGSFRDQAEKAEILKEAEQAGIPTYESKFSGRFDLRSIGELASFLKRERIQLLCTHGFKASTIGAFSKRIASVPQIAFCRGWTGETPRVRAYEFLERRALRFADHIVCVSEAQAEILGRSPRLRLRITVVHNAMLAPVTPASESQRAAHKAQLGFSPDTLLIGTVGRLSIEKGQRYLVEAAAQLLHEFRDVRIVLLGEGRERANLEAQIAELGLGDFIQLVGFKKNIAPWYKALDVLVNCSLTEGIPNAILEALAAGTPVVATAVGGVPELIKDRETGVLLPPANSAAMARGLTLVLRNPQLRSTLGQAGQRWVQTNFSPARQQEALLMIYRSSLGLAPLPAAPESKGPNQNYSISQESTSGEQARQKSLEASDLPFISVVIPVRNEEKHVGQVLRDLANQDYPSDRYEILVVDGNSTDNTASVVEEIGKSASVRIQLLSNPRQLSSAGRNVGVRASSGELIVFIDGHCHVPGTLLLRDTAQLFQTTGSDCLCRPQPLSAPGNNWFQQVVADVRASLIGHGSDSTIFAVDAEGFINPTSSGASYRRKVFDQIGFYDERLDACEDVEFNYRVFRAGLRSFTSPKIQVQYSPRNTLSGLWKQMVRYGKGRRRFVGIHPEAFSVSQTIPAIFLLWLLFGGLAALTSTFFAKIYLSTVAIYAGIVLLSSLWLGMRCSWRHIFTAPAVYLTIHLGLGFGYLSESIRSLRMRFPSQRSLAVKGVATGGSSTEARVAGASQAPIHSEPELAAKVSSRVSAELDEPLPRHSAVCQSDGTTQTHAFSVDVEDYFHTEAMSSVVSRERWDEMPSKVENNTRRLFELLAKHDVCGTFFFLGWVAERYPNLVRDAVRLGHEVGCHSFWHRPVFRLSPEEFRADTLKAKQSIEDVGGVRVRGYRAPSFSMVPGTEWAIEILADLGFDYDSSVHPIRHDLYDNASASRGPHRIGDRAILELPIATTRVGSTNLPIGGGGYLRILPYAYTHWGLTRFSRIEAQPAVFYLHPWEIDPQQPRLRAPAKSRFRQYTGLTTTESKLITLLKEFRFAAIETVYQEELLRGTPALRRRAPEKDSSASFPANHPEHDLKTADPVRGN